MLVAFVAGNFAELRAARRGVPQDPMESHELLATLTAWGFVFLAAWRFALGQRAKRSRLAVYLALAAVACGLLIVTGHPGAMLVYERGDAVQARRRSFPASRRAPQTNCMTPIIRWNFRFVTKSFHHS